MAVIFIEGFDHFTASAEAQAKGWSTNFGSMQPGRFTGQAAAVGAAENVKPFNSTSTTVFFGTAFRPTSSVSIDLYDLRPAASSTRTVRVSVSAAGLIQILNSAGTVLATGTTTLVAGTWYYLEVKAICNGASGAVEAHLNGAVEIASTTVNIGSTALGQVALRQTNNQFDDMYCCDAAGSAPRNTFLGDVRVSTIYPTSDGAHTQWSPNSGTTHWTQVSEAQADGDTTYVSDSTPNDLDTYVCGTIDTGATVFGLQANLYARKDDAATRQIAPVIRQSGTDNVGTTVTLSSTYLFYSQLYNQDPTSADWTPTTVNADEYGIKEIA